MAVDIKTIILDPAHVSTKIPAATFDDAIKKALEYTGLGISNRIKIDLTAMGSHDPLMTATSSPPGDRPQIASGKLRDSIRSSAAQRMSPRRYQIYIGPGGSEKGPIGPRGGISYAFTQEFGATMTAKTSAGMRFRYDGTNFRLQTVTVPARPFMQPAYEYEQTRVVDDFWNAFKAQLSGYWITS